MIKPKLEYDSVFSIAYDILLKHYELEEKLEANELNIGASCNCDNTNIEASLQELKDIIQNKECGCKETIIEKPVIVEKPVEVIKEVIVEKPIIKEIIKVVYRDCNCGSCNHQSGETEIINIIYPNNNEPNKPIDYSPKILNPNNTTDKVVRSAVCPNITIQNPYYNFRKAQREKFLKKIPTMTSCELCHFLRKHPEYHQTVQELRGTKTIKKSIAH